VEGGAQPNPAPLAEAHSPRYELSDRSATRMARPLWVKSRHMQCKTAYPLYSQERTFCGAIGTFAKGQIGHRICSARKGYVIFLSGLFDTRQTQRDPA